MLSGPIDPVNAVVTSFPSWLGSADPSNDYGPAFAGEYGNRAAFPLVIIGNDVQISIDQLAFNATGTNGALDFGFAQGSYNYNTGYQGILKGADGILGTADDTFITSGPNTQQVDAIVGRGSGNGLWPCQVGDPAPCATIAEKQAAINAEADVLSGLIFTGTYTYGGSLSASADIQFNSPEPATFAMIGGGLTLLALVRRRRQN